MFKWNVHFLMLLPALLFLVLPAGSDFQIRDHRGVVLEPEVIASSPCSEIEVTRVGAVCKSTYGFIARLDFPEVDLERVLAGEEYLPDAKAVFAQEEKTIGDKTYRDVVFSLDWKPVTPEFLQNYIHEYIPYWGNQVPYRLLWTARYQECSIKNCAEWTTANMNGEFLPSDIKDLQNDLAADANFNGVPAAFWNTNVLP
jgi:hypothetical protein